MSYEKPARIETILKHLPAKPGVYLLKNGVGKVIYVGEAIAESRTQLFYDAG